MQKVSFAKLTTFIAMFTLSACDGGSASFNPPDDPPPDDPPPVDEPPAIAVEPAFLQLAFEQPLAMMQSPDDSTSWFVVEKAGVVWRFPDDADASLDDVVLFADITDRVDSSPTEAGLLGMAFHPDFSTNREVYLSYTRSFGGLESVISRFILDPATGALDESSEEILLTVPQFDNNHNGGSIVFGPDGFLYLGLGDGGGSGDPRENGQDTTNLLATISRIDVDSATPYAIPPDNPFAGNTECFQGSGTADCPEIFAWGFRNPWRFSFDRETGELWVGDVGENSWEEIDRVRVSENFGWSQREGAHCFDPPTGCSTDNVDPIAEYSHDLGSSVTGGYVYRGGEIPDLEGFYLFGDFGSGRIWVVAADSNQGAEPDELADTNLNIASFAESNEGEIYVIDITMGTIHRIVGL